MPQYASRTCRRCGVPFTPTNGRQSYCTRRCRDLATFDLRREAAANRTCETCGIEIAGAGIRFCSRACIRHNPQVPCAACGAMFARKYADQRFCSYPCKAVGMRSPIGTRRVDSNGYVLVRVPEDTPGLERDRAWMREHRYVMQQQLGRPLRADETVHHLNGDKADNRPENLQLRTGRHGKGVAHECLDCGSRNVGEICL